MFWHVSWVDPSRMTFCGVNKPWGHVRLERWDGTCWWRHSRYVLWKLPNSREFSISNYATVQRLSLICCVSFVILQRHFLLLSIVRGTPTSIAMLVTSRLRDLLWDGALRGGFWLICIGIFFLILLLSIFFPARALGYCVLPSFPHAHYTRSTSKRRHLVHITTMRQPLQLWVLVNEANLVVNLWRCERDDVVTLRRRWRQKLASTSVECREGFSGISVGFHGGH